LTALKSDYSFWFSALTFNSYYEKSSELYFICSSRVCFSFSLAFYFYCKSIYLSLKSSRVEISSMRLNTCDSIIYSD